MDMITCDCGAEIWKVCSQNITRKSTKHVWLNAKHMEKDVYKMIPARGPQTLYLTLKVKKEFVIG